MMHTPGAAARVVWAGRTGRGHLHGGLGQGTCTGNTGSGKVQEHWRGLDPEVEGAWGRWEG